MTISLLISTRRQTVELTACERTVLAHALCIISDPSIIAPHLRNIRGSISSIMLQNLGIQDRPFRYEKIISPARELRDLVVMGGTIDPSSSHMVLITILEHNPECRNAVFPRSPAIDLTLSTNLATAVRKMYCALIDGGPVEVTLTESASEEDTGEVKDLGHVAYSSSTEDLTLSYQTQESAEEQEMPFKETRCATKKQLRLRKVVDEVNALLTDANHNADPFIVDLFADVIPQFKIVHEHKKRVTLEVTNAPAFAPEAIATYTHLTVHEALSRIAVSSNGLYDCFVEPIQRHKVSRSSGPSSTTLARKKFQLYIDELAANCAKALDVVHAAAKK